MRYYLDTEFNDNGLTIDMISIALVSEDGREYYAVSNEFDESRCGEWLQKNVLAHLPPKETWKTRDRIAAEIYKFTNPRFNPPEFWAYFAAYDWVVFCQLYGRMLELPPGFPHGIMDIRQILVENKIPKNDLPPQKGIAHDALNDARWVRDCHLWIKENL